MTISKTLILHICDADNKMAQMNSSTTWHFDAQSSYVVQTGLELFEIKDSSRTGFDIPGSKICRVHPPEYWGYSCLNCVLLLYATWRLMREGCDNWIPHRDVFPIFFPCIFLNSRSCLKSVNLIRLGLTRISVTSIFPTLPHFLTWMGHLEPTWYGVALWGNY